MSYKITITDKTNGETYTGTVENTEQLKGYAIAIMKSVPEGMKEMIQNKSVKAYIYHEQFNITVKTIPSREQKIQEINDLLRVAGTELRNDEYIHRIDKSELKTKSLVDHMYDCIQDHVKNQD